MLLYLWYKFVRRPRTTVSVIIFLKSIKEAIKKVAHGTGKSVSEALILELANSQHYDRLLIDLQLLTQKNTNSEHVFYKNYFECQNKNKKQANYSILLGYGHHPFLLQPT